jgi:hypothetical protein
MYFIIFRYSYLHGMTVDNRVLVDIEFFAQNNPYIK